VTVASDRTAPSAALSVGQLVLGRDDRGIARIAEVHGARVRIEWFESAAKPVTESEWVRRSGLERAHLGRETRVYWQDESTGRWRFGRVVGGGPESYFVRAPNLARDQEIAEGDLRVRWERPVGDPLQLLLVGAQESPAFRDVRMPVLCANIEEHAACASTPAVISARVDLHAHQIDTAMRVLADPVQRYLLADEVGLGKTIEAGFVIRQRFLDDPRAKVVVVAPDVLQQQWRDEMASRFFLDDFPRA
jgi:ATP-dependent helicase HepA